ncbi:MAG: hypothetical protein FJW40_15690 [Acidobacteria bacterium]|nr:hypothetical protein [Acidobacteriota bacterium]
MVHNPRGGTQRGAGRGTHLSSHAVRGGAVQSEQSSARQDEPVVFDGGVDGAAAQEDGSRGVVERSGQQHTAVVLKHTGIDDVSRRKLVALGKREASKIGQRGIHPQGAGEFHRTLIPEVARHSALRANGGSGLIEEIAEESGVSNGDHAVIDDHGINLAAQQFERALRTDGETLRGAERDILRERKSR